MAALACGRASNGSPWLTAYVTEFLTTRAREKGFDVPQRNLSFALDKLSNTLNYASDFKDGGEAVAYSLYVLARNKRARLSELRYYADEKLNAFRQSHGQGATGNRPVHCMAIRCAPKRSTIMPLVCLQNHFGVQSAPLQLRLWLKSLRDGAATLALVSETGLRQQLAADPYQPRT